MLCRAVVFRVDGELPPEARRLMDDFRQDHPGMYSQHMVCSFEVAASRFGQDPQR